MVELDRIEKLPEKERIQRLKEIKEQKLRELEEAEKLLIEAEKKKTEKKSKELQEKIIDELEKKELKKNLEEELIKTNIKTPTLEENNNQNKYHKFPSFNEQYISELSKKPINDLYKKAQILYEQSKEENFDDYQTNINIGEITAALYQKEKDIKEGLYTSNEKVITELDSTKKILESLISNYRRNE
jgi:hypothetical protein